MKRARASSPEISQRMKLLKKAGTGIECEVGRVLWTHGLRYRKNVKGLPGRPDFANRHRKWAIFVNGCFWHHHTGCRRATIPKANREFWLDKFARNRRRDAKAIWDLRRKGFRVVVIWECQRSTGAARLDKILEPRGVDG